MTKPLIFATTFVCFFSILVTPFNDILDVDRDRIFESQYINICLGQRRVFWLCLYLLLATYSVAMNMGVVTEKYRNPGGMQTSWIAFESGWEFI